MLKEPWNVTQRTKPTIKMPRTGNLLKLSHSFTLTKKPYNKNPHCVGTYLLVVINILVKLISEQ